MISTSLMSPALSTWLVSSLNILIFNSEWRSLFFSLILKIGSGPLMLVHVGGVIIWSSAISATHLDAVLVLGSCLSLILLAAVYCLFVLILGWGWNYSSDWKCNQQSILTRWWTVVLSTSSLGLGRLKTRGVISCDCGLTNLTWALQVSVKPYIAWISFILSAVFSLQRLIYWCRYASDTLQTCNNYSRDLSLTQPIPECRYACMAILKVSHMSGILRVLKILYLSYFEVFKAKVTRNLIKHPEPRSV